MSASYQQQLERLRRENQELLEQVHSSRPDQGSAVQVGRSVGVKGRNLPFVLCMFVCIEVKFYLRGLSGTL